MMALESAPVSRILWLAVCLLLVQTVTIILLAVGTVEWVYPVSLAILAVLFCVYAILKERKLARLSASVHEIAALYRAHRTIGALALDGVAQAVLRVIVAAAGTKRGSVFLRDELTGTITWRHGVSEDGVGFQGEVELAREAVATGQPILTIGGTDDPNITSALFVPLSVGAGVAGVLSVYTAAEDGKRLKTQDAQLVMTLARYASPILAQAGTLQPAEMA